MYRFMLAGLSSVIISDLSPTMAQDWPAIVSIYVDRPMYRSMLAGLFSASISDLGQPNHAQNKPAIVPIYAGYPVFRRYF